MTDTQLGLLVFVWIAGVIAGAFIGKRRGSATLGLLLTLVLGPAIGLLLLFPLTGDGRILPPMDD